MTHTDTQVFHPSSDADIAGDYEAFKLTEAELEAILTTQPENQA